jgi:hypothetical protein
VGIRDFFMPMRPKEAASEAGWKYLTTAGFRGDQIKDLPRDDEELISAVAADVEKSMSTGAHRSIMPYIGIRDSRDAFKKAKAFLQNYDSYLYTKEIRKKADEGTAYKKYVAELDVTLLNQRDSLVRCAWLLIGQTFKNLDEATLLSVEPKVTPYIIDAATRSGGPPDPKDAGIPFRRDGS